MTCEGGPAEGGGDPLPIKIAACDLLPRGVILLCRLDLVDEADGLLRAAPEIAAAYTGLNLVDEA